MHIRTVGTAIDDGEVNRVLGVPPPNVSNEGVELSRPDRRTLAQLRSGCCPALNDFRNRIVTGIFSHGLKIMLV